MSGSSPQKHRSNPSTQKNSQHQGASQSPQVNRPPIGQSTAQSNQINRVLVLGRQASGKSSFINILDGIEPNGKYFLTKHFRNVELKTHPFRLIDSPGFDNMYQTDCEIFVQLMEFLAPEGTQYTKHKTLKGVIYIHPQADDLNSVILARNIRALKHLLGEVYLSRVTVLVSHVLPNTSSSGITAESLQQSDSPFDVLKGAVFRDFKSNKDALDALLAYTEHEPLNFHAQQKLQDEKSSVKAIRPYVLSRFQLARSLPPKVTPANGGNGQKNNNAEFESGIDRNDLLGQLQRTKFEYASLRAHLQIDEKIEKSQVTQKLRELNRKIEDLGRAVSDYLVDKHTKPDATSRNAHNLDGLKSMFGSAPGKSSLVESSSGAGMPAPDFFDHAVRSILCTKLYLRIFQPFHPNICGNLAGSFALDLYRSMQKQEAQVVAGKWRKDTFNSISRSLGPAKTDRIKADIFNNVVSAGIKPLIDHFFGPSPKVVLQQQHTEALRELISDAWEYNKLLKGFIVLLGDFTPFAHPYGEAFDPNRMTEFEGDSGGKSPEYILSTIGLGMNLVYAVGEDKEPTESVFQPACVATEFLFD